MRKKVYRYTKDDHIFVYQMLQLRSQGLSYVRIGEMFNKHHSTIIHWCKRFKVDIGRTPPNLEELDFFLTKKPVINKFKYTEILDEPINMGKKSYSDYLKEQDLIKFRKKMSVFSGKH